ncbi:MAG: [protein-PII] uridylyltransferase [Terriglobales bacterium]
MATSTRSLGLRDLYTRDSARIRKAFEAASDGLAAATQRAKLVDEIVLRLWQELISAHSAGPRGFCLAARGGYGRGTLLPHSDVDLLFLSDADAILNRHKDGIGRMCQQMWDLHLRASPTARTVSGCAQFDPSNAELTLSLLDCRYLGGDRQVFDRLQQETVPQVVHRNWDALVQGLSELTRTRHTKYGNTVFHLEPNIKECPGGLRDYNVACWLGFIAASEKQRKRGESGATVEYFVPQECENALRFLMSVRCFLHYLHGRDDNTLSWEAQDAAAGKGVGIDGQPFDNAAEWMRHYFRHARPISRWTNQLLDEVSAARSSLYRQFLSWRSRVSNADFSVVEGRVYLQQSSAVQDPELVLRAFEFTARHSLKLAGDTERRISQALASLSFPQGAELWSHLREVLLAPSAAQALRDMHALGLLDTILPEYRLIDSLVIRDFYHRYTVDEHSFAAIDSLHQLHHPEAESEARYAEILKEVEEPELLYLTVLLHDIGKGLPHDSHVDGSLEAAENVLARLSLSEEQRETVRFLIANHLEMSAALRRDIFDHETVRAFAQKVGSSERLKMLCLLSYADIRAVNPHALTPWKAEDLWHLYVATGNYLNHSADDASFQAALEAEYVNKITALVPRQEKPLREFLAGLPQRYLRAYSSEQIAMHFAVAARLRQQPVQLALKFTRDLFELTLITRDRPFLFATISGTLTAWRMDIVKANAFTSQAGMVVDTLSFRDRFRTLEQNPPERERFKRNLMETVAGEVDVEQLIASRVSTARLAPIRVTVDTRLAFDNESSSHSTLLEVIAQDRPGLLHKIASILARHGCSIEIALIDTEGQMAIDVFYVTRNGAKLDAETQKSLRAALHDELEDDKLGNAGKNLV